MTALPPRLPCNAAQCVGLDYAHPSSKYRLTYKIIEAFDPYGYLMDGRDPTVGSEESRANPLSAARGKDIKSSVSHESNESESCDSDFSLAPASLPSGDDDALPITDTIEASNPVRSLRTRSCAMQYPDVQIFQD
jgi:hypothetical protein